jgi:Ca2+-binding RTX toxin-like protein
MATIPGTAGNDLLRAPADGDVLIGRGGNDALISTLNDTTLRGCTGNDYLSIDVSYLFYNYKTSIHSALDGGAGRDTLIAEAHLETDAKSAIVVNRLDGGSGADSLTATAGVTVSREARILSRSRQPRRTRFAEALDMTFCAASPMHAARMPVR